jgi:hypothetical protein
MVEWLAVLLRVREARTVVLFPIFYCLWYSPLTALWNQKGECKSDSGAKKTMAQVEKMKTADKLRGGVNAAEVV